jgi:hypothetical protein
MTTSTQINDDQTAMDDDNPRRYSASIISTAIIAVVLLGVILSAVWIGVIFWAVGHFIHVW